MNNIVKNVIIIVGVILLLILFIIFGKSKNNIRIYLDENYYNNGNSVVMNSEEVNNLEDSFILFTYNSACAFSRPCEEVFDTVLKDKKIDYVMIPFNEFRETKYYDIVKYAPSVLIINKGSVISYLNPDDDNHLAYYQDEKEFEKWLSTYIYFEKEKKACVK